MVSPMLTRDVDDTIKARADRDPEFRKALADEYEAAIAEIERLWNAAPGTPEHDRLAELGVWVHTHEDEHWPIDMIP